MQCTSGLFLIYSAANLWRAEEFSLFTFFSVKVPRNAEIKILFAVARTLLLTPIMPMGLTGLPDPTTLSDALYIHLYHQKFRPQLVMRNAHDFFSLANSRTPFSASSYSNIPAFFEKHFSVKLTTNDLRKCVVDYLLSLPASGDHALRYFLLSFFTCFLIPKRFHFFFLSFLYLLFLL